MTLSKLKTSEQLLIAIVMIVIFLGSYGWLRFVPKNDAIALLRSQSEATEKKLLTARIPDEPEQGVEELLKQLDDQEHALALIRTMADSVSDRLAAFDSQELKVRISELARNAKVRIRSNEAYVTKAPPPATQQKSNKKKVKVTSVVISTDLILPSSHSWIERMSAGTLFHRPMQRLVLEGDYHALRSFIHGLAELDWQVTVVNLKVEIMPTSPLRGNAQRLSSELVLAL